MNTENNNKLLAEFLGNNYSLEKLPIVNTKGIPLTGFEENWSLLMLVVEKIESLGCGISIVGGSKGFACVIAYGNGAHFVGNDKTNETKIQSVYNACIDFVEWYNAQKKETV